MTSGRLVIGAALALLAGAGCNSVDPTTQIQYDAYKGDAFPNRRAKIVIPAGGMAVVTDSRSDTVSFVDLTSGKKMGSYPVGLDPVTIDGPHHVAVDPVKGAVFVALSYPALAGATGPHASHGASILPGYVQKLALDDMRPLGQVRIDANPGDVVLSEDKKRLVVSHFDLQRALKNPGNIDAQRSTLALIDPDQVLPSGSPDPTLIPLCIAAHGVTLSRPDGAIAYAACYGEDALALADLTHPKAPVKRIPVGASPGIGNPNYGPYAAVMSPDGKTIAVSNTASKDVRFFDVASETFDLTKTIKTQGAPYFVAWTADSAKIYIPTQAPDALHFVDVTQNNLEISFRDMSGVCEKPHAAELSGLKQLFLVCEGDQTTPGDVVMLDPASLTTMSSTKVGIYPDAFVRVLGGAK